MRLSDDAHTTMREALMLTVESGDPEDEESPEERELRDRRMLGAVAWLDAPGIVLKLSEEDYNDVLGALDYAAEDYASRADFEERQTPTDAPDDDREEQHEYEDAADRYSGLAERIRTTQEVQA